MHGSARAHANAAAAAAAAAAVATAAAADAAAAAAAALAAAHHDKLPSRAVLELLRDAPRAQCAAAPQQQRGRDAPQPPRVERRVRRVLSTAAAAAPP